MKKYNPCPLRHFELFERHNRRSADPARAAAPVPSCLSAEQHPMFSSGGHGERPIVYGRVG